MAQILNKKQIKNQLIQGGVKISFSEKSKQKQITKKIEDEVPPIIKNTHNVLPELKSTTLHLIIVALLLVLIIVIDTKTPYLNELGERMYSFLRLNT